MGVIKRGELFNLSFFVLESAPLLLRALMFLNILSHRMWGELRFTQSQPEGPCSRPCSDALFRPLWASPGAGVPPASPHLYGLESRSHPHPFQCLYLHAAALPEAVLEACSPQVMLVHFTALPRSWPLW